ncbi:hypothetical protein ACHWQZ_G013209 [Mnemiopsis leidyi]
MDRKTQTDFDCMETLCVLYWIHLSDLEFEKLPTISKMLQIHFQSAPLKSFPFYMKTRVELHELLVSVREASKEELADQKFREGVFNVINDIFEALECPNRADEWVIQDLKKAEIIFINHGKLLDFQLTHGIHGSSLNSVLDLTDEEFDNYCRLLRKVLNMCDFVTEMPYVRIKSLNKVEFVKTFNNLGDDSFSKFEHEIFKSFLYVFSKGLKFFHASLGKPKHFKTSSVLEGDLLSQLGQDSFMSSCESVHDSFENVDKENSSVCKVVDSTTRKSFKKKVSLKEMLRSRSPPKESEMMKAEGFLWDDSNSDILSVSGSSGKRVKWASQESKDLVDGVKKHGLGQWAMIRADRKLNLGHKSNVQLKDRWRNLIKNDPSLKRLG